MPSKVPQFAKVSAGNSKVAINRMSEKGTGAGKAASAASKGTANKQRSRRKSELNDKSESDSSFGRLVGE